ncbi:MAG: Gp15 family bacteriophage protein [Candidatus Limiplasma sp.]|nr:Gp15 family bacteriophage protein [Candidatus Limiplasma sp.]
MPEQPQTPVQTAPDALPAFSLALPPQRVLPTELISAADGRAYPIDADFRTVLACLRRLEDPERDALQKRLYLAKRFFGGNPPPDMDALFLAFIAGGAPAREEAPLMHFERDAGAIYASFLQQYGLDLLTVRLHWVAFRELLAGLNENTALGARVRLRALDETALPPEERARVRRLKEQLALPAPVSRAEQALLVELDRRLAAGEDPADVLTQLREV